MKCGLKHVAFSYYFFAPFVCSIFYECLAESLHSLIKCLIGLQWPGVLLAVPAGGVAMCPVPAKELLDLGRARQPNPRTLIKNAN